MKRVYSRLLANVGFAALLLVAPSVGMAQSLGSAQSFAIVGGSTATAAGTGSTIDGDVGVSPGTSITGFDGTSATIVPPFSAHVNDGQAIAAQTSVGALYTLLASAGPCSPLAAQLNGISVGPGVYCFSSTADLAASGNLTLNGSGLYIFQVGSMLTANVLSTVTLLGGADPCNVFWQVTSAATLNGANFVGNVVAQAAVTLGSGATLVGRALTTPAGAVTIAGSNSIGGCSIAGTTPTPTPAPTATGGPTSTAGGPTATGGATATPGPTTGGPTSTPGGPTATPGTSTPRPTTSVSTPTRTPVLPPVPPPGTGVPTLSDWGLLGLVISLMAVALVVLRRQVPRA